MEIDPRLVGEDEAMKDVLWTGNRAHDNGGEEGSGIYAGDSDHDDHDHDDADDVSEADSDYLELQADIARLDASRNAFLSEHLGANYDPMDDVGMGRSGRGGSLNKTAGGGAPVSAAAASVSAAAARRRRGPRKAAEPTGEVKFRLQQAHQLFMDNRYEDALAALHEIIRVNAETHAAWSLMASINEDLGRREEAMMAKLFAAHLEPKNVTGWLSAADYALEIAADAEAQAAADRENGEDVDNNDDDDDEARQSRRLQNLQVAQLCYSGAIRADKDNIPARLGKANVCLEFGQATNAATEYVRVLKRRPLALQVIRNLAEASYDSVRGSETIRAAINAYRKATTYLRSRSSAASTSYFAPYLLLDDGEEFTWMDITIYVELFASLKKYTEAVALLKTLARWMLGRGGPDEAYWATMPGTATRTAGGDDDDDDDDDREWDRYDEPRRRQVPGFQPGRYPASAYGEGLPVDLRAKLAIYRLKLGHEDEAIEHLSWIDPQDAGTTESMRMYPHLLKDVGAELFESRRYELALQYLELYRDLSRSLAAELNGYDLSIGGAGADSGAAADVPDDDAEALVLQGKCSLELHDHVAAEESFLAAIEADDENIDARFELAKMYEKAHAKEQAYILVNEALSLEAAQQKRQQAERQEREDRDGGSGRREDGEGDRDRDRDGDGDGDGEDDGAAGANRRRGPMASLETGSYRVFFNEEGKVVRRRRKFRKGPDGQEILISAEQNRLNRAAARQAYGDDDDESNALGVLIRPKPPGGAGGAAGARPTSQQKQLRQLQRQQRREQQQNSAQRPRQARRRPRLARRLFASPAEQAEFEASTSARLRARYHKCREAKERGDAGDADAAAEWMEAAKELINDFRSFREFYTWDKYVQFLGVNNLIQDNGGAAVVEGPRAHAQAQAAAPAMAAASGAGGQQHSSGLTALAERLQQNLAPADDTADANANANRRRDYRGIPFDDWLALFLEYALGLAHAGRTAEAYAVCQSAHDSTVYRQEDSMFLIHLAWASCAVRAGDEETCVAVARYFMRDRPYTTDCYRLFTTMCRLCRAPLSGSGPGSALGPGAWFSSSPAQKYILRQIRQKDDIIRQDINREAAGDGPYAGLDTCLLVVYGHILFASTSYHFALNYYQRALAVDPSNAVIKMCIGLSYVHWALKRQAENRQYLVTQGLNFLYQYAEGRMGGGSLYARREAYYNLGRTYHLLGLHALAAEFYGKVLREEDGDGDGDGLDKMDKTSRPAVATDLRVEAAYNLRTYYILAGNTEAAMQITRAYLVL